MKSVQDHPPTSGRLGLRWLNPYEARGIKLAAGRALQPASQLSPDAAMAIGNACERGVGNASKFYNGWQAAFALNKSKPVGSGVGEECCLHSSRICQLHTLRKRSGVTLGLTL